ncbi:MAG: hypothetical protein RR139_11365 [Lachnospiraceae bacterium]
MSKVAKSVSVIEGSNGPTAIFLMDNKQMEKNLFRRMKHVFRIKRHQYRLQRAKKSIKPGIHTLYETICYMKEHYVMTEVDKDSPLYKKSMQRMKRSIIQREKIDLLPKLPKKKQLQNKETLYQGHQELKEWQKQAEAVAEKMSPEILNMDYHLFVLDKGEDGSMQIELEMNRALIEVQYSGNRKVMDGILRDIYLYYGVSREDIANETERYRYLLCVLT